MPIPDFIVQTRELIGTREMWLPGVTAVVTRVGAGGLELLLVQRSDNGAWTPITGIPEPREEPAVAAAREALEETGVVVRVERLASAGVMAGVVHANGDEASYLDLTFRCTWLSGEAHVADDESIDVGWFPFNAMPTMSSVMLGRIDAALSAEQAARFEGSR